MLCDVLQNVIHYDGLGVQVSIILFLLFDQYK